MRKPLKSKKAERKQQLRNQRIVAFVFLGILLFGTLGYGFMSSPDEGNSIEVIRLNNNDFFQYNGFWVTEIGNNKYYFESLPNETIDVNVEGLNPINKYFNSPLYIVSREEDPQFQLYLNFQEIALRMQEACFDGETCYGEGQDIEACLRGQDCLESRLPYKNCSDNLIYINISEENSITQEENCVFIKGKKEDLSSLVDEFLYRIAGIK